MNGVTGLLEWITLPLSSKQLTGENLVLRGKFKHETLPIHTNVV